MGMSYDRAERTASHQRVCRHSKKTSIMAPHNSRYPYDIEGSEWRQAEKSSSLFFLLILFALVALDYQLKELLNNYLKKTI